jgi:Flp pilus assembly protein TadG
VMRIKEMRQNRQKARRGLRGQAIVEVALMAPWIFFLFVGVLDFGFYSYAAICTQNAARVVAIANSYSTASASDLVGACNIVVNEMNSLPNVRLSSYTCSGTLTQANPINLSLSSVTVSGLPTVQATVSYLTVPLIPIPGLMTGQLTFFRRAQMPIINP